MIFQTLFLLCNYYLWGRPCFLDVEHTSPQVCYWIKWNSEKPVFETDGVKGPWTMKQSKSVSVCNLCFLLWKFSLTSKHKWSLTGFQIILRTFSVDVFGSCHCYSPVIWEGRRVFDPRIFCNPSTILIVIFEIFVDQLKRILKTNPLPYKIPEQLTKRIILSQCNSIYDPLGLSGPFTVRAKIRMCQIWARDIKMNWDNPIPEANKQDWIMFFKELHEMDNVKFKRCMKPCDTVGDSILIIFCDGSS